MAEISLPIFLEDVGNHINWIASHQLLEATDETRAVLNTSDLVLPTPIQKNLQKIVGYLMAQIDMFIAHEWEDASKELIILAQETHMKDKFLSNWIEPQG
jgi:hypothetical protein